MPYSLYSTVQGQLADITDARLDHIEAGVSADSAIVNDGVLSLPNEQQGFTPSRWDDLRVSVLATKGGGIQDPTWTQVRTNGAGSQGVYGWSFSQTTEEEVFFDVQLPHTWEAGTELRPHVHWTHLVASPPGTTSVVWALEYTWANAVNPPGNTFGQTSIVRGTQLVEAGSQYKQFITDLTPLDGTGKRLSSVLLCRLFREPTNVADTFAAGAIALSIDFHYLSNTWGSVAEYPAG